MKPLTPQEVRLGNLTSHGVVSSIDKDVFSTVKDGKIYHSIYTQIHPVPITPEILEGFGFIKKEDNEYHLKYELIIKGNFILYIFNKTFTAYNRLKANFGAFNVTHAHALQNFVQSISGVELVYNNKSEQK